MDYTTITCPLDSLPTFGSGRRSEAKRVLREIEYREEFKLFEEWMNSIVLSLGFAPGTRTWNYLFEQAQLITKGNFSAGTNFLTKHRRKHKDNPYGLYLPHYLVAEDDTRRIVGFDYTDSEETDVEFFQRKFKRFLETAHEYNPHSFWEFQSYAPIVVFEKRDIMNLCRKFIPYEIKTYATKGYGDINSRRKLIEQIKRYEEMGLTPVVFLLYDHDPAGFHITEIFRRNLQDVAEVHRYSGVPDLMIRRIGLSEKQVDDHDFSKIWNLESSSGLEMDDPDHKHFTKKYVQDYLTQFRQGDGKVWKCESNALITSPAAAKQIMEDSVMSYLSLSGIDSWTAANADATKNIAHMFEQARILMHCGFESGLICNPTLLAAQKQADNLKLLGGS